MAEQKRKREKPDVGALLNRLAASENEFLQREFLAPCLREGIVHVRIAGVVCKIRIQPRDFQGWGVFRPSSHNDATFVRQPTLAERRSYLALFPQVRMIVCRRQGNTWFGSPANFGDTRIQIDGIVPLQFATEVQLFDCVRMRYDGTTFWFDEIDLRHDPGHAAYLRTALAQPMIPDELKRPGLTAEERAAYELNYWELTQPPAEPHTEDDSDHNATRNAPHRRRSDRPLPGRESEEADPVRRRLRENLSHAGAQLVDYLERADGFRVRYTVGGQQYTSSVAKHDLTVQVAGICLSGQDQKFDLASLVGVLREADDQGGVYRFDD